MGAASALLPRRGLVHHALFCFFYIPPIKFSRPSCSPLSASTLSGTSTERDAWSIMIIDGTGLPRFYFTLLSSLLGKWFERVFFLFSLPLYHFFLLSFVVLLDFTPTTTYSYTLNLILVVAMPSALVGPRTSATASPFLLRYSLRISSDGRRPTWRQQSEAREDYSLLFLMWCSFMLGYTNLIFFSFYLAGIRWSFKTVVYCHLMWWCLTWLEMMIRNVM